MVFLFYTVVKGEIIWSIVTRKLSKLDLVPHWQLLNCCNTNSKFCKHLWENLTHRKETREVFLVSSFINEMHSNSSNHTTWAFKLTNNTVSFFLAVLLTYSCPAIETRGVAVDLNHSLVFFSGKKVMNWGQMGTKLQPILLNHLLVHILFCHRHLKKKC